MTDATSIILVVGVFVASAFNAAFSAGGALIILAITVTVLPIQVIVPIHSTLLIGSTVTRTLFFWEHVDWKIAGPFLVGGVVGALLGARIYFALPETIIATAISILMLVSVWLPGVTWRPNIRHPWVILGLLHSLVSSLFAYGAVLQSVILHSSLKRRQIVATMAGSLLGVSVFKIAGYAYFGFDYAPYRVVIVAGFLVSIAGTALGKKIGEYLPEKNFRLVFRILVTATAARLLYAGLA